MDGPEEMRGQGAWIVRVFLPFLLLIHFDQLWYFAPTFKKKSAALINDSLTLRRRLHSLAITTLKEQED